MSAKSRAWVPPPLFLRQLHVVEPEHSPDRMSFRHARDFQYCQLCILTGREAAIDLSPNLCIFQVVAGEIRVRAVRVADNNPGAAGAFEIARSEIARKIIRSVRGKRNE